MGRTVEGSLYEAKEVCRDAVATYGATSQIGMVHEELSELSIALNRWQRGRCSFESVAEEIADVLLMCLQAIELGPPGSEERVANQIGLRADRLRLRMEASARRKRLASCSSSSQSASACLERVEPGVADGQEKLGAFDFWR
jgi:hypothetical protein